MNRLEKYCSLIEHIYGERIVKAFTTKSEKPPTLKMNNVANNQKEKKNYDRKDGEGCKICKDKFRNEDFFKRNLEFPGWIEYLDFSGDTPAKEIMIIGEAPPKLKEHINIAFGLGYYPIDSNGELNFVQLKKTYSGEELKRIINNQKTKNRLWKYLNLLFPDTLDVLKPKIYITDLCKCNDDKVENGTLVKNQNIWKICGDKYLIDEIKLINPKLIIFLGAESHKYVTKYLNQKKVNSGKFTFNGKDIHFFMIYHQRYFYRWLDKNEKSDYVNQANQFMEILKEVLQIKLKLK